MSVQLQWGTNHPVSYTHLDVYKRQAQNQETVWLSSERKENCLYLVQHSISGKSADILESLCFQLECPDNQTAQRLICLLKAMNWKIGIGAIGWQYAGFLREQNLVLDPNFRSMFCYVGLDGEEQKGDCLSLIHI